MQPQNVMPQCGLMVVAASPELDEKFSCRLLLGSKALAEWLGKNRRHVGWSDPETCDEMLSWLKCADSNSNKLVTLPQRYYQLISGHIEDLVDTIPRLFLCAQCNSTHDQLKSLTQPITDTEIYTSWYVLWICPGGHVLYRSLTELHISPGD